MTGLGWFINKLQAGVCPTLADVKSKESSWSIFFLGQSKFQRQDSTCAVRAPLLSDPFIAGEAQAW